MIDLIKLKGEGQGDGDCAVIELLRLRGAFTEEFAEFMKFLITSAHLSKVNARFPRTANRKSNKSLFN